ncbi:hypothetical protein AB0D10_01005 [Kitasatospora sp. NPDC048545]|uniref:hypothetical protein n=1 Tax=Kitasatospora sp. NPDC048545 TaxID=3157208 RepID=UPI0033D99C6E
MTTPEHQVLGDLAADTVARTGIPVLLLADQEGPATITAAIDGEPRRYTATTVTYADGLRGEVHTPGGPTPEELARRALPGGRAATDVYLATPGRLTVGVEVRHDGLLARAGTWNGWNLLTVTIDRRQSSSLPALRLVGADSLPTGRPGRALAPAAALEPAPTPSRSIP